MIAWLARSLLRTLAPMVVAPLERGDLGEWRWLTSMRAVGCSTPYFMRSTRLVPPPRNFAPEGGCVDRFFGSGRHVDN